MNKYVVTNYAKDVITVQKYFRKKEISLTWCHLGRIPKDRERSDAENRTIWAEGAAWAGERQGNGQCVQKLEGSQGDLGWNWKGVWKLNLSRQGLWDELCSVSWGSYYRVFNYFNLLMYLLVMPHNLWDLSSQTRDWTETLNNKSAKS